MTKMSFKKKPISNNAQKIFFNFTFCLYIILQYIFEIGFVLLTNNL